MAEDPAAVPELKALRLFVAIGIPERAKSAADRALGPWRERLPNARWVKPENWHVTLKFLGRTRPPVLDRVRDACRAAAARVRPFGVRLDGLGVFPRPSKARVFWVGLAGDEGGMAAMARELDRELDGDFPPEKRAFTAHLTVARLNPPAPVDADELARSKVDPSRFSVGQITLFESHLSPKGARYEPLERFPLRG